MLVFSYRNAWAVDYTGTPIELSWLKKLFTYKDLKDFQHKKRFGYFPEYCTIGEVMSHGQVIHAVREAKKSNLVVTVHDPNHRYLIETGRIPADYLPGCTGRDYQLLSAEIALGCGHGILKIGTSGGKTFIMGMVVKRLVLETDCKGIMILILSKDLLDQTAERFVSYGVPSDDIGIIHSDISPKEQQIASQKRVVLSTHLSIPKFNGTINRIEYVITDECFPAGTIIGDKKIEDLCIGDKVPSFDEVSGKISTDIVVSKMVKKPSSLLTLSTMAGPITCTSEHPFWTPQGWVVASHIRSGMVVAYDKNHMRHLRTRNGETNEVGGAGSKLRPLHNRKNKKTLCCSNLSVKMFGMRLPCSCEHNRKEIQAQNKRRSPLQQGVYNLTQKENQWIKAGCLESDTFLETNAGRQPDVQGGYPYKNVKEVEGNWSPTSGKRRKRLSPSNTPTKALRSPGVGLDNGISYKNNGLCECGGNKASPVLQVGHSQPKFDDIDRGRWRESQPFENKGKGRKENEGIIWVRVENVTVHKPGSDGKFGGRCPNGYVYNIETKKHHTYIADGFIVHNCHRSIGPLWSALFPMLPNLKNILGFTATPWDTEAERQKMLSIYGQILVDIPVSWLIKKGYVLNPEIYFIRLHYKDRNNKLIETMDWRTAEKQFILEERNRNLLPIVVLNKFGGRMLVLYDKLDHGKNLQELYIQQGFETRLAEGITSTTDRKSAIEWFQQPCHEGQRGKVLLASKVFDEGIDIKGGCDLGFLIGAGQDESRTKQRIGRLLRINSSGKVRIFDVQDTNHPILSRWSGSRRRAIREETGIEAKVISLETFASMNDDSKVVSEESGPDN